MRYLRLISFDLQLVLILMDTPKYKELQQQFAEQADEKGRIDTLLSMAVEVRSYDVEESLKLADEIRMSVLPIILGEGRPFFYGIKAEQALHLKSSTAYKNGMVELVYEINKSQT